MIKQKFTGHMHQLRMNAIDDFCRHIPQTNLAISDHVGMNMTHTQKYLVFMEKQGYLIADKSSGKGNTYKSAKTFCMLPVGDLKPTRSQKDYDLPVRYAPHIKAFADTKALPRDFFAATQCDVSH